MRNDPDTHGRVFEARSDLIRAALGYVLAADYGDESSPHHGDSIQYNEDALALAARDLAEATEALPRADRPVGWNKREAVAQ